MAELRKHGSIDVPLREIPDDAVAWADGIRAAATTVDLHVVFLQHSDHVTIVDIEH